MMMLSERSKQRQEKMTNSNADRETKNFGGLASGLAKTILQDTASERKKKRSGRQKKGGKQYLGVDRNELC